MKPTVISGVTIIALAIAVYFLWFNQQSLSASGIDSATAVQPMATDQSYKRYVFDVTLHSAEEIDSLLARAEKLAQTTRTINSESGIALVLHGPEIAFFANKNYLKYKTIVDRAEQLDAKSVIEIKMCQTQMRNMGVKVDDIPSFIELVPFGPDEIKRLQRSGYISL